MDTQKTLQIAGREVIVKKLPLGKYAQLIEILNTLPDVLKELVKPITATVDENGQSIPPSANQIGNYILTQLPRLITEQQETIFKLISIISGLDVAFIRDEVGLDDLSDILAAFFEVNNYDKIKKNLETLGILKGKPSVPIAG